MVRIFAVTEKQSRFGSNAKVVGQAAGLSRDGVVRNIPGREFESSQNPKRREPSVNFVTHCCPGASDIRFGIADLPQMHLAIAQKLTLEIIGHSFLLLVRQRRQLANCRRTNHAYSNPTGRLSAGRHGLVAAGVGVVVTSGHMEIPIPQSQQKFPHVFERSR